MRPGTNCTSLCARSARPSGGTGNCSICNATCTATVTGTAHRCGDLIVDALPDGGSEACDDGNNTTEATCPYNTPNCGACKATCTQALSLDAGVCGDGVKNTGFEACDDRNANTCGTCSSDCSSQQAVAAASALDGTSAGIDKAITVAGQAVQNYTFSYNSDSVSWSSAALTFGTAADGGTAGWVDGATAKANAAKTFFARVDTSALAPNHGEVDDYLITILSSAFATTNVTAAAVAGRDSLNVLPLAICANSNTSAASLPSGELVEYGFRRGVSYNLMNLNPGGTTPENLLVNPIAPPGTVGTTMMNRMDVVAPFVCTGKMAIPTLEGGDITVERPFPISSLYVHLNSRFGTYVTPCQSSTAPADPNVRVFDLNNVGWMKNKPDGQSANALTSARSWFSSYGWRTPGRPASAPEASATTSDVGLSRETRCATPALAASPSEYSNTATVGVSRDASVNVPWQVSHSTNVPSRSSGMIGMKKSVNHRRAVRCR